MRYAFALLVLAGCASADVGKMSDLDLCYTARVDEDNKSKAESEIQRRKVDCQKYSAQIQKMWDEEQRAGVTGGGIGDATPKQGGGMLNKGY